MSWRLGVQEQCLVSNEWDTFYIDLQITRYLFTTKMNVFDMSTYG